jgi:hypothetical protein
MRNHLKEARVIPYKLIFAKHYGNTDNIIPAGRRFQLAEVGAHVEHIRMLM